MSWPVMAGLAFLAVTSLLGGSYLLGYNKGYSNGYTQAVTEVNRANNAAQEAARRSVEERNARCVSNPSECLSDPWTRDRPN